MPGFATHYIFGRETYHKLSHSPRKRNLYHNRAAYAIGLQGPDMFFYYLPSYAWQRHNIGALAHTKETRAFFCGLFYSALSFRQPEDRAIADAYLTGFLGHYTLDTICHPFIYGRTHYRPADKTYFSRHAYLETDIDTNLLHEKLHHGPSDFYNVDTIALTARQNHVIASMLYHAFHYAYPTMTLHKSTMYLGIFSLQLGMQILHDNTGQKKVFFRLLERNLLGYPLFSPLIPSESLFFRTDPLNLRHKTWKNPWNPSISSRESFPELYQKAMDQYLTRIGMLWTTLDCGSDPDKQRRLFRAFLKEYKNLSFHSGLDCSIPS